MQRRDLYSPPLNAPETVGFEYAGVIETIGRTESRFAVGDRGCALLAGGGYAE